MMLKSFFVFLCVAGISMDLFSQNTTILKIEVTVPGNVDISKVNASIPNLKFNKKFIYSFTFDDTPVSAFSKAFPHINKKWIDANGNFHLNQKRSTGRYAAKTLGYTDGCGNERRFAFGIAMWPNWGNNWIPNYMDISGSTANHPYVLWKDTPPMLDFGSSLYFHNVDERAHPADNPKTILAGLMSDQAKTLKKTGRGIKVLVRPDGNNNYIDAGKQFKDIKMMTLEDWEPKYKYYPNHPDFNLTGAIQSRRNMEAIERKGDFEQLKAAYSKPYDALWMHDFAHDAQAYVLDHFTRINDTYGKDGADCVWFATLDEVYEYWYIKKNCKITRTVSDRKITFEIQVLTQEYFYYTDFSLMLSGIASTEGVSIGTSSNIYGLSYAGNDKSLLVNINFNRMLLDRADKYTNLYLQSRSQEDKDDALYFVSQLKSDLKSSYLLRLGVIQNQGKK